MSESTGTRKRGAERAAIFLMSLGEDEAAAVLKHLGPKEVQQLGAAMSGVSNVSREEVDAVFDGFLTEIQRHTSLGVGSSDYVRSVLVKALGEDKAGGIIDRILVGGQTKGLDSLKWLDARTIAEMIRLEHPQIIAIVLSYLDSDQAAEVLLELPERARPDVLMRMATLDGVQPAALHELDDILERQLSGNQSIQSSTVGGVRSAAELLNYVDTANETTLLEQVQEVDAELARQIQDLMFVFDNLLDVEDVSIQTLLREVQSDTLARALKGADEAVRSKFLKNMSSRAAELLRDDLDVMGPVRISEVEEAQRDILAAARRMADEGRISLGGKGEPYV